MGYSPIPSVMEGVAPGISSTPLRLLRTSTCRRRTNVEAPRTPSPPGGCAVRSRAPRGSGSRACAVCVAACLGAERLRTRGRGDEQMTTSIGVRAARVVAVVALARRRRSARCAAPAAGAATTNPCKVLKQSEIQTGVRRHRRQRQEGAQHAGERAVRVPGGRRRRPPRRHRHRAPDDHRRQGRVHRAEEDRRRVRADRRRAELALRGEAARRRTPEGRRAGRRAGRLHRSPTRCPSTSTTTRPSSPSSRRSQPSGSDPSDTTRGRSGVRPVRLRASTATRIPRTSWLRDDVPCTTTSAWTSGRSRASTTC